MFDNLFMLTSMVLSFYFIFRFVWFLEHELYHATESENLVELEEIGLQVPKHTPPPVPVYTQINITIPCSSPQLDSLGSSPKSDYSSYSSSSGKQIATVDTAKDKILTDIRSLNPKLKSVHLSDKQSPRINYIVSTMGAADTKETFDKSVKTETKKISIELDNDPKNYDKTSYVNQQVTRVNTQSVNKQGPNESSEKNICVVCNNEITR